MKKIVVVFGLVIAGLLGVTVSNAISGKPAAMACSEQPC